MTMITTHLPIEASLIHERREGPGKNLFGCEWRSHGMYHEAMAM